MDSPKRVKQLHGTLLARPDLAWSVKSLGVKTKGGRAEVEAISRLLLACPVLEELNHLKGPAQIPAVLITVASLNMPSESLVSFGAPFEADLQLPSAL